MGSYDLQCQRMGWLPPDSLYNHIVSWIVRRGKLDELWNLMALAEVWSEH